MANRKVVDLPELITMSNDDELYIVDISDLTESSEGTSKKIKASNFVPAGGELIANKQNSLTADGTGVKYPTVDAINDLDDNLLHKTGNETKNGSLVVIDTGNGYGVNAISTTGVGLNSSSDSGSALDASTNSGIAARFISIVGSKIVSFLSGDSIEQAYILASGLFKSNKILVNTTTDNGVDVGQFNGTVSASPATLLNQVIVKSQLDTNLASKADKQGTILYHSVKWFTPSSTVSNVGATVTSIGTQFTAAMVGSILRINDEDRLILSYTSSTVVVVDVAYSTNYSGVVAGSWGVYSIAYMSSRLIGLNTSTSLFYSTSGVFTIGIDANGNYNSTSLYALFNRVNPERLVLKNAGFIEIPDNGQIRISSTSDSQATKDLGLRRNAAGILEIYDGVTATGLLANRRDLMVRKLFVNKSTDNGIDSLQVDGTISMSPATLSTQGVVKSQLDLKQDTLISATNIKTVGGVSILGAGDIPVNQILTIQTTKTNPAYTLVLSDASTVIPIISSGSSTITVPTNATVAFPIGTKIEFTQITGGTGQTAINGVGVTFLGNQNIFDGDYTSIIKVGTNTWTFTGISKVYPIFSNKVTGSYFFANNGSEGFITSKFNSLRDSSDSLALHSGVGGGIGSSPHVKFTQAYPFSSSPNLSTGQVVKNIDISSAYTAVGGDTSARILNFEPTINQTGGASGIIRAIYINPTLTAVADFRAIEVTSGKSLFKEVIADGVVRLKNYTVATLPTGVQGDTAYVTDALTPTYLGTAVGGGAVVCKVFFNGTNWIT